MNAAEYIPAFKFGHKVYPQNLVLPSMPLEGGNVFFVDGDKSAGSHAGKTWEDAFPTLVAAEAAASAGDLIFVANKTNAATDTDPQSYTENLVINTPNLSIIGVSRGRTQGGLPQLKVGATTTSPVITISAPGVMIANIGINGAGGTGGGILLNDDGGTTAAAFGWSILGCHFKNCVGTTATNALTGGAVMIGANGGAWQGLLAGNKFYKNVGDFILKGTSGSVPQDIVIEDNIFSSPAANVDVCVITGGSGINGLFLRNNDFPAMPALSSATTARYVDLTGSVGLMSGNRFGSLTAATGSPVTFAAAGTGGLVPTTVFMADNWGETTTAGESGEIIRT
jgi:hypothetical protein